MTRLRRRRLPREPIRTVEAVVVARTETVDRAGEEVLPAPETLAHTRSGPLPLTEAPEPPTPQPVSEPAVGEKPVLSTAPDAEAPWSSGPGDKDEQEWLEEELTPAIPRSKPDQVADERNHSERTFVAERVDDDYPPSDDDEDIDSLLPATVDTTTCTIAVWRGYRKATFYAQAFDARGQEVGLAESAHFRWRGNGTIEKTEAATRAHSALLELLRHSGWEPTQEGSSWFDLTLTRR